MVNGYNCDFVEQSALMASMEDDDEGLSEILRSMLPNERRALRSACWSVVQRIDELT